MSAEVLLAVAFFREPFVVRFEVETETATYRRGTKVYRRRRAFLRLVFGLGRPFSLPDSSSEPSPEDFSGLLFLLILARRRLRPRST
jgi:hypothetical protein